MRENLDKAEVKLNDLPAKGEHQVVVIDEKTITKEKRSPLKFSAYPVGLVSESLTFPREDLYAND